MLSNAESAHQTDKNHHTSENLRLSVGELPAGENISGRRDESRGITRSFSLVIPDV